MIYTYLFLIFHIFFSPPNGSIHRPFQQPTAIDFSGGAQEVNGRRRSWGWGRRPNPWSLTWNLKHGWLEDDPYLFGQVNFQRRTVKLRGGVSIPLWQTFFFWVLTCLTIRFSISFCFILCNLSRTLVVEICHQFSTRNWLLDRRRSQPRWLPKRSLNLPFGPGNPEIFVQIFLF